MASFGVVVGYCKEPVRRRLKEMFKMIDTDNRGQITFQELKGGLKALGANIDETEIHNLIMQAVSNLKIFTSRKRNMISISLSTH